MAGWKTDVFNNHFDAGDVLGSLFLSGGVTSLVGIGTFALFGTSFSDKLFQLDATVIPISVASIWTAALIAFITNSRMEFSELMNRPTWELGSVGWLLAGPVLVTWLDGINYWMLQNYYNGSIVAVSFVLGFFVVGYRSGRDKKNSLRDVLGRFKEA